MYPSKTDPRFGVFVANKVEALRSRGIDVELLSVIKGMQKGIVVKLKSYFLFYFRILRIVWKRPDRLYVHYPIYALLPLTLVYPFLKKSSLIFNFHGNDLLGNSKMIKVCEPLYFLLRKKVHRYVVPSQFFSTELAKRYDIDPSLIHVYPSGGIDTTVFFRKSKQELNGKIRIGFVGRLDDKKGWKVFMNALQQLSIEVIERVEVLFIINYFGKEEAFEAFLKKLNPHLNFTIKTECSQKELAGYYNILDYFIFPTLYQESLGLVGVEAMACGVPVIGSRIGALPEYIVPGKSGALFEPGNSKELCEIISDLVNNPKNTSDLRKESIKIASKYERNLQINNLIESVII